eukprot:TRINITY_DN1450_c0_g1_i50.p1 TRINITY_DN1450_c0_g1~~TRINITY_DN1450_c0_g1_i50.p1  ORF type:complete len:172 (-),score=27.57 TRINITY_DN1450_c0_g1_i50:233-748(-)
MLSNPNSLKFFEDVSKLIPTADKTLFNSIRRLFGSIGYISKYHPSYERGLRILSLDGGGTRSLTSVLILKKIEEMTGMGPAKEVKNADSYSHLLEQIGHSCCETEQTHHLLESILPSSVYFRLQPMGEEIFSIPLDETSPEKLEMLITATNHYIDKNISIFQKIVSVLANT